MVKRKEVIFILCLFLSVILLISGVSMAAFSYSGVGQKINKITSGSIAMEYTESDNTISIDGALPTTDSTGMVRLRDGEYFDFTISSTIVGDTNINYEISAKDVTDSDAKKIDGKYIKLYLTKINNDGSETSLMAPDVYNEDTSKNVYTGRPAGEMSLYTSSMGGSESNDYRLRLYVDEDYNPQDDGGDLTFSVKVNVYGQSGDKYVPETTKTILADNTLQEEKTAMFNYTSDGKAYNKSEQDSNYITTGLYSSEDDDGISYYYRGDIDNNNVQFGSYDEDYYVYKTTSPTSSSTEYIFQTLSSCQALNSSCSESNKIKLASAGDKMYWKIIRINGDGSLRLIYNGTSINPSTTSNTIGVTPYNQTITDKKYTGYTYDGTASLIKKEVDTWYKNTLGASNYNTKVTGGRFCSDTSDLNTTNNLLMGISGAPFQRLGQTLTGLKEDNYPTLKCPTTSENYGGSYRLKAGLITADELVFAGKAVNTNNTIYLDKDTTNPFWTMTPAGYSNSAGLGYIGAQMFISNTSLTYNFANNQGYIRPVINVSTFDDFASGDGTSSNPYVLSI